MQRTPGVAPYKSSYLDCLMRFTETLRLARRKAGTLRNLLKNRGLLSSLIEVSLRYFPSQSQYCAVAHRKLRSFIRYSFWRLYHPRRKIVFLTFADGTKFTSFRLEMEVGSLKLFDEIICYDAESLGNDFFNVYREHVTFERGYGYWAWKPYIILKTLRTLHPRDILIYADAGCSVVPDSKHLLREELMRLANSQEQLMVVDGPQYPIKRWTKSDLLAHFGYSLNDPAANSWQVEAGRIALTASAENIRLIEKWSKTAEVLHLIDDSPSVLPNDVSFVEHRHDQSILSLCVRERPYLSGLERVFLAARLQR